MERRRRYISQEAKIHFALLRHSTSSSRRWWRGHVLICCGAARLVGLALERCAMWGLKPGEDDEELEAIHEAFDKYDREAEAQQTHDHHHDSHHYGGEGGSHHSSGGGSHHYDGGRQSGGGGGGYAPRQPAASSYSSQGQKRSYDYERGHDYGGR
jgi:uncharacterized membrane protein YgcG